VLTFSLSLLVCCALSFEPLEPGAQTPIQTPCHVDEIGAGVRFAQTCAQQVAAAAASSWQFAKREVKADRMLHEELTHIPHKRKQQPLVIGWHVVCDSQALRRFRNEAPREPHSSAQRH